MFTPSHRSLNYILNGLIVIGLVLGGLAPVGTAPAANAVGSDEQAPPFQGSAGTPALSTESRLKVTNDADNGEAGPVWVTVDVLGPASVGPGEG